MPKNAVFYFCDFCHFKCSKKSNYVLHLTTRKHIIRTNSNQKNAENAENAEKMFSCEYCSSEYTSKSGLWYHKLKCVKPESNNDDLKTMFLEMVKQNADFRQIMMEQNSKLIEIASNTGNNTNINYNNNNNTINNKFNLQIFLNETCKDAMNIQEFIDYVTVQHSDFENFGKMGYVEALTRIFLRNLMELEVHRRPIHCSDLKREVLYVKDNDVWVSDVSREKLIRTIKYIANKNVKQIPGWMDKNPDSKNTQTKLHDKYMRMLCFSMGAKTEEEDQEYYKKIIHNVAKEVCIDKVR